MTTTPRPFHYATDASPLQPLTLDDEHAIDGLRWRSQGRDFGLIHDFNDVVHGCCAFPNLDAGVVLQAGIDANGYHIARLVWPDGDVTEVTHYETHAAVDALEQWMREQIRTNNG